MTPAGASLTMLGRVASIPVVVTEDAQLSDASGRPVLFWFIEGAIAVHPTRLEDFRVRVVSGKLPVPVP